MKDKKTPPKFRALNFCKSPEEYIPFDARSAKPIYYVKDVDENGKIDDSESAIMQEMDEIKFSASNNLLYLAPNNVGVLLSITNKSLNEAKTIFDTKLNPDKFKHTLKDTSINNKNIIINKSITLYDFIETIQSSIVFAYTSLETFANLSIPNTYEYKIKSKSKGILEIYDKEAIERWVSLKEKLSTILVDIYKTTDITKKPVWSHFIKLEQYRNDIIHQKSITRTEFYKKYFNRDIFKTCACAEQLIDFFYKQHGIENYSNPLWPWLINTKIEFSIKKIKDSRFTPLHTIF